MIRCFSDNPIILDSNKKSIFLAGPTLRNDTFENSWRKQACDILEKYKFDGIVYIPEFEKDTNPMNLLNQVEWEREGLINADVIAFYIPRKLPELPGFTTNVEFGMYLARRPDAVWLCSPQDAQKNRYLEWLYLKESLNDTIYSDLEIFLKEIVESLSES